MGKAGEEEYLEFYLQASDLSGTAVNEHPIVFSY